MRRNRSWNFQLLVICRTLTAFALTLLAVAVAGCSEADDAGQGPKVSPTLPASSNTESPNLPAVQNRSEELVVFEHAGAAQLTAQRLTFDVPAGVTRLAASAYLNVTGAGLYAVRSDEGSAPALHFEPGAGNEGGFVLVLQSAEGIASGPESLAGPLGAELETPAATQWLVTIDAVGTNVWIDVVVVATVISPSTS